MVVGTVATVEIAGLDGVLILRPVVLHLLAMICILVTSYGDAFSGTITSHTRPVNTFLGGDLWNVDRI